MGEWFTYLSSVAAIRIIEPEQSSTAVSILYVARLLPSVLFLPVTFILADRGDRRKNMIALDLLGALVAVVFFGAFRMKSITLIYIATFLQGCVSAAYEPIRTSIVPLMTPDDDEQQKATYLTGMAWSFMIAAGAALGGIFVTLVGVEACYFIDSATYLLSALLMAMVGGTWEVTTTAGTTASDSPLQVIKGVLLDGVQYLRQSDFGLLVLIKPSMALLWGACDVLEVSFSTSGSVENSSLRLGLLMASGAIGAIAGPLLTDRYANMQAPTCVQRLCLWGMALLSAGIFVMGLVSDHFVLLCLFGVFRGMGASMIWINSSLLLQKFSLPNFLGQITTIELALNVLGEAASAFGAGALMDHAGWTARQVSFALGSLGACLVVFWTVYYLQGKGAAVYELKQLKSKSSDFDTQDLTASETMDEVSSSEWDEVFGDVQDPPRKLDSTVRISEGAPHSSQSSTSTDTVEWDEASV